MRARAAQASRRRHTVRRRAGYASSLSIAECVSRTGCGSPSTRKREPSGQCTAAESRPRNGTQSSVINFAVARISTRIGNGSSLAPASRAAAPWRASSSRIAATMARLSRIGCRQAIHVVRQMFLDLALGLDDKPQVAAVSSNAGDKTDRERPGVPERIGVARARAKLGQTLPVPTRDDLPPLAQRVRTVRGRRRPSP